MKKKCPTSHKLTKDKREAIIKLVTAGDSVGDLAALYKISRENIYALCKRRGVKIPKGISKAARIRLLKNKIDTM